MSPLPLVVSLNEFESNLLKQIRCCENGISEYDLIQKLREQNLFRIDDELLSSNSLTMFQIHFTLYHCLYRLRDQLRVNKQFELELSPICINLKIFQQGNSGLVEHDPLYEYYMDIGNLLNTETKDVDDMLERFWMQLDNSERREEALLELGLADPVNNEEIQMQYRRMAMRHHPDRGGDKKKLQAINIAVSVLLNSFNPGAQ